jgi:drug/metabolite transporter (DMT)-like permease
VSVANTNAITRPPGADVALLAVAVVAISTSGPMIAACTAPALAIAFWRCGLGAGLTAPVAWWRHRAARGSLTGREWRLMVGAGLLLAAHFALWVPSLRLTSVASATALVATQPIWAAIIARLRGARVAPRVWVGIAVALTGVLVLTGIDFAIDPRAFVGDLMATAGAVMSAAYVTAGAEVRRTVSTSTFTTTAYAVSAGVLLVVCLAGGQPLSGYTVRDWVLIALLTLVAQLLGHTVLAVVLSTTSPTVVSLAILFEMPGATLIAAWWLGQAPPVDILPAVVLLFVGVAVVITGADSPVVGEEPPV